MQVTYMISDNSKETWGFWLDKSLGDTFTLYLDSFTLSVRASKRHIWKRQNWWSRTMNRDSTIKTRPEPPAHIVKQAREQLCQAIMDCEVK